MTYLEQIDECTSLEKLYKVWKTKDAGRQRIVYEGKTEYLTIDYRENGFICDGIVDKTVWDKKKPKILFVLKSSGYVGDKHRRNMTFSMYLKEYFSSDLWTVGEWAKGMLMTDENSLCHPFEQRCEYDLNRWREISVLFIKKEIRGGLGKPNPDLIDLYAKNDRYEIRKEIEIIDPDIVVCCSTFRTLLSVLYDKRIVSIANPHKDEITQSLNWCYKLPINGKDKLFIDYVEPGYPNLMAYYGLVGIYQQVLKNGFLKGEE